MGGDHIPLGLRGEGQNKIGFSMDDFSAMRSLADCELEGEPSGPFPDGANAEQQPQILPPRVTMTLGNDRRLATQEKAAGCESAALCGKKTEKTVL